MIVRQTEDKVVARRLLVCLEVGVCCRLVVPVYESLHLGGYTCVESAEMLCRDIVVVLLLVSVHHTTGKKTQGDFVDGVVGSYYQHEVVDVGLRIASCRTSTTLNVISRNHSGIDGGVGVVLALHVACHEPCHYKGY